MIEEALLDQALATAFADYVAHWECGREWGRVFWSDRVGVSLEPGELQMGTHDEVGLFPYAVRRRFAAGLAQGRQDLIGTYHAHHDGLSYMEQFPSASDLVEASSLVDYWGTRDGRCLPLCIRFDLIQSGEYGDVFVIARRSDRTAFQDIEEQNRRLRQSLFLYSAEIQSAAGIGAPSPHAVFIEAARAVLHTAVRHLEDRITVTLRPHPASPAEYLEKA